MPWLKKPAVLTAILIGLLLALGLFVVEPTEMAGVRRFGEVTTREPYGPGIHLKLPLIDQVDRLQVSLDILRVQDLTMYTVDNQWVKISVGMTYRIPTAAVFLLLYQVGRSGSFGIRENVEPIIADRAMRVFARRNTIKISEEREAIARYESRSTSSMGAAAENTVNRSVSRPNTPPRPRHSAPPPPPLPHTAAGEASRPPPFWRSQRPAEKLS